MPNLFSAINYQYLKPCNFEEKNPEFDIFLNVPAENCFAPKIHILKNVRISNNSVIFNYFKIVKASCLAGNYKKYATGRRFFLKFIFPQINFSNKRFLLITDEWTSNYYHWHIFALKKLLLLKEKGWFEDSILLLPKKYRQYKFVLPSLTKFGITKNQIVFLRRKSNIKVAELPLIKLPQQHPAAFCEIRKILLQNTIKTAIKIDFNFGNKIYISREGQALRFVENEQETVALLKKYGFQKLIIDHFSYDEQIAICCNIKYLVSPHGAGLTNLLFMVKNSSVLEMTTRPSVIKPLSDYYKLANMLGIRYFYQECKMGPKSKVQDSHHASLMVDLKKLEKNLQLMLKND
jgi:capsular polysaccharide biosynthesis protein